MSTQFQSSKKNQKGDILRMADAATPAGSASSRPASVKIQAHRKSERTNIEISGQSWMSRLGFPYHAGGELIWRCTRYATVGTLRQRIVKVEPLKPEKRATEAFQIGIRIFQDSVASPCCYLDCVFQRVPSCYFPRYFRRSR